MIAPYISQDDLFQRQQVERPGTLSVRNEFADVTVTDETATKFEQLKVARSNGHYVVRVKSGSQFNPNSLVFKEGRFTHNLHSDVIAHKGRYVYLYAKQSILKGMDPLYSTPVSTTGSILTVIAWATATEAAAESVSADLETSAKNWELPEVLPFQALSEVGYYGAFLDTTV